MFQETTDTSGDLLPALIPSDFYMLIRALKDTLAFRARESAMRGDGLREAIDAMASAYPGYATESIEHTISRLKTFILNHLVALIDEECGLKPQASTLSSEDITLSVFEARTRMNVANTAFNDAVKALKEAPQDTQKQATLTQATEHKAHAESVLGAAYLRCRDFIQKNHIRIINAACTPAEIDQHLSGINLGSAIESCQIALRFFTPESVGGTYQNNPFFPMENLERTDEQTNRLRKTFQVAMAFLEDTTRNNKQREQALNLLITELAEIRRAHNEDNPSPSIQKGRQDYTSCGPGTGTRLAKSQVDAWPEFRQLDLVESVLDAWRSALVEQYTVLMQPLSGDALRMSLSDPTDDAGHLQVLVDARALLTAIQAPDNHAFMADDKQALHASFEALSQWMILCCPNHDIGKRGQGLKALIKKEIEQARADVLEQATLQQNDGASLETIIAGMAEDLSTVIGDTGLIPDWSSCYTNPERALARALQAAQEAPRRSERLFDLHKQLIAPWVGMDARGTLELLCSGSQWQKVFAQTIENLTGRDGVSKEKIDALRQRLQMVSVGDIEYQNLLLIAAYPEIAPQLHQVFGNLSEKLEEQWESDTERAEALVEEAAQQTYDALALDDLEESAAIDGVKKELFALPSKACHDTALETAYRALLQAKLESLDLSPLRSRVVPEQPYEFPEPASLETLQAFVNDPRFYEKISKESYAKMIEHAQCQNLDTISFGKVLAHPHSGSLNVEQLGHLIEHHAFKNLTFLQLKLLILQHRAFSKDLPVNALLLVIKHPSADNSLLDKILEKPELDPKFLISILTDNDISLDTRLLTSIINHPSANNLVLETILGKSELDPKVLIAMLTQNHISLDEGLLTAIYNTSRILPKNLDGLIIERIQALTSEAAGALYRACPHILPKHFDGLTIEQIQALTSEAAGALYRACPHILPKHFDGLGKKAIKVLTSEAAVDLYRSFPSVLPKIFKKFHTPQIKLLISEDAKILYNECPNILPSTFEDIPNINDKSSLNLISALISKNALALYKERSDILPQNFYSLSIDKIKNLISEDALAVYAALDSISPRDFEAFTSKEIQTLTSENALALYKERSDILPQNFKGFDSEEIQTLTSENALALYKERSDILPENFKGFDSEEIQTLTSENALALYKERSDIFPKDLCFFSEEKMGILVSPDALAVYSARPNISPRDFECFTSEEILEKIKILTNLIALDTKALFFSDTTTTHGEHTENHAQAYSSKKPPR